MNQQEAKEMVRQYILSEFPNMEIELVMGKTIVKEYGWVFFYQTKKYLETNQLRDMLIGNCPILVTKEGEMILLPTYRRAVDSLKKYEAGLLNSHEDREE